MNNILDLNPKAIMGLIYSPLEKDTALQLHPALRDEDVQEVRFIRFCKLLMTEVLAKPVKLTQKGNLPRKIVHQMYNYRLYVSSYIDDGTRKLLKEEDFYSLTLAHSLLKMSGIARKYNNKLMLTKKGEKIKDQVQDAKLYKELLKAYTGKFNWSYLSYLEDKIAQYGWAVIMYLFLKYGDIERPVRFYETPYLLVLPEMMNEVPQTILMSIHKNIFL